MHVLLAVVLMVLVHDGAQGFTEAGEQEKITDHDFEDDSSDLGI